MYLHSDPLAPELFEEGLRADPCPAEGSLVKFGGFEIGFESDFGKFVHNSVVNLAKFDKIWLKSDL